MKKSEKEQISEINQRYKDAPWIANAKDVNIIIGGAGGIGSGVIFLLGRMGYTLYIYDFDVVGKENIGVQFYKNGNVGEAKVSAINYLVSEFNPSFENRITAINGRFDHTGITSGIMISCFDNMGARKQMYTSWLNYTKTLEPALERNTLYLDGRLGPEYFEIFAVQGGTNRTERYKKELFEDSEVLDLPCSFKATPHTAFLISGMIVGCLTNFLTNVYMGMDVRDVPYKTEFQVPIMNLITTQ